MAKIDFRGPCRAFTNRVREGIFSHENIVKNWLRRKICDWWLNLDALLDAMFLHDQSLRVKIHGEWAGRINCGSTTNETN